MPDSDWLVSVFTFASSGDRLPEPDCQGLSFPLHTIYTLISAMQFLLKRKDHNIKALKGLHGQAFWANSGGDHSSLTPFTPFTQAHMVEMFCQQCHASIGGPRSS